MREDVGPILGQQRGSVTLALGIGIDGLGLLAIADDAPDASIANHHDKFIHGGILRQGEHVNRLDLGVIRIIEFLDDLDTGNIAVDGGGNVGVLKGQGNLFYLIGQLGHERATAQIILGCLGFFTARLGDDPQFLLQGWHCALRACNQAFR